MGQQCDRCGGIDRCNDEARDRGSTRAALGLGGCYSLWVKKTNHSVPHKSSVPYNSCVSHPG